MSTVRSNIVRIAERRLHLVTDDEVQQLGLTSRAIARRLKVGNLHRVVPGVLSTTSGPYDVSQRELALCLSDPRVVLSHMCGRVLGHPTGTEGSRRGDGAEGVPPERTQRGRPLQQLDAGTPRRRAGRRGARHERGQNGLRPGWGARCGRPPVGDRGRPRQGPVH